jgi:hypothetical protein
VVAALPEFKPHKLKKNYDICDLRPAALTTTKIINKLLIKQDVLLRTAITQVRRHIDDL